MWFGASLCLLLLHIAPSLAFNSAPTPSINSARASKMTAAEPFKILVLHGKGDNERYFAESLKPLQQKLQHSSRPVQWDFMTAPCDLAPNRYAWWTLPPGVRSFEATEYIGIDGSFQKIEEKWRSDGPYDAMLGHSQGAIILSVIIAKAMVEGYTVQPKYAILCGAAWPKPFEGLLDKMREGFEGITESAYRPQTLHSFSHEDTINPAEMAIRIMKLCGPASVQYVHQGGHIVPQDDEAVGTFGRFLSGR